MRPSGLPNTFPPVSSLSYRRLKKEKRHFGCASKRALYASRESRPIRYIAGLRLVTRERSCAVAKRKTPTHNTAEGLEAWERQAGPQLAKPGREPILEAEGRELTRIHIT